MKPRVIRNHREESQTLVEFAVCLPLLALLLFGIIQWGFIIAAHVTVRNASAVGARQAVLSGWDDARAEAAAEDALSPMLDKTRGDATVVITNIAGGASSDAKMMVVTYDLPLIIPFVVPGGGNTRTITARTIMR